MATACPYCEKEFHALFLKDYNRLVGHILNSHKDQVKDMIRLKINEYNNENF